MKKIIIMFASICAGQIYGMEPIKTKEEKQKEALAIYTSLKMLPELQQEIITQALAVSDSFGETIDMIKKLSILHGMEFDKLNLKDFTKWAHILADRFDAYTATVASEFKTPIAQTYLTLGYELLDFARDSTEAAHNGITDLIKQGADVNFSTYKTPLELVIESHDLKGVQLLLKLGAKPTSKDLYVAQREAKWNTEYKEIIWNKEIIIIKDLIEKAMKK